MGRKQPNPHPPEGAVKPPPPPAPPGGDYVPYGAEWEKEMMRWTKKELAAEIRRICIASSSALGYLTRALKAMQLSDPAYRRSDIGYIYERVNSAIESLSAVDDEPAAGEKDHHEGARLNAANAASLREFNGPGTKEGVNNGDV